MLNILFGERCQMCGRRKKDVFVRARLGATCCNDCAKVMRMVGETRKKK